MSSAATSTQSKWGSALTKTYIQQNSRSSQSPHTHTHIHTITFKDMNTSSQGSLLVDMLCQTTFSLLAF